MEIDGEVERDGEEVKRDEVGKSNGEEGGGIETGRRGSERAERRGGERWRE